MQEVGGRLTGGVKARRYRMKEEGRRNESRRGERRGKRRRRSEIERRRRMGG